MALIPWWIRYPNVNDEIMNLDWLLRVSNENTEKISNFINLNTIKYANPILWDIASQYEANTITVDPQTGDAYISTKAVPYGVALSNTEYWTKIYNYANVVDTLREQIVADNEGERTTASKDHEAGDLVWLNGKLAVITRDILAGTEYIEKTESVGITGNFVYTTVNAETIARYSSDNMRLIIHGYVDPNTQIVTRGDYHVYDGARQAIDIVEV